MKKHRKSFSKTEAFYHILLFFLTLGIGNLFLLLLAAKERHKKHHAHSLFQQRTLRVESHLAPKEIRHSLAEEKGKRGEGSIRSLLKTSLKPHYIINDICIETKEGDSSQIDHVLINTHGIWVIETKNYAGKIYGQADQKDWFYPSGRGKEPKPFYNPLMQNETHANVLQSYLGADIPFHSLVVFLNTDISAINHPCVINAEDIYKTVSAGEELLSSEQIQEYALKLEEVVKMHSISLEEHLENVARLQEKRQIIICPRCRKPLEIINQEGDLTVWGCTSYPNCTFTKSNR